MKPTVEEIQERLRQVLLKSLSEPPDAEQIGLDVSLMTDGLGLDSVALLELVIGIENEFDIILDDGSLTVEPFESLAALAEFVFSKLDQPPQQQAA